MKLANVLGNIGCAALGTIAPPFGGMAANFIKDALGLDKEATEQQMLEAVKNATPEQVVALKNAEYEFKTKLKELDVDVIELEQKDRDSARRMQTKTKSLVPAVLSVSITVGFFGALYTMLIDGVPPGEKDVLLVMLGALGTAWANVCQYWFGSSTGSKDKTEIMKKF